MQLISRLSPIHWLYAFITVACHLTAILVYWTLPQAHSSNDISRFVLLFILICATFTAWMELYSPERTKYVAAVIVHAVLILCAVPLTANAMGIVLCLYSALIIGICIHVPFPSSIVISLAILLLLVFVQSFSLWYRGLPMHDVIARGIEAGAFSALLTLFCSLMTLYRERFIETYLENKRLDGLIDRLSRANLEYQEYAKSVQESSTEAERKRITRDIHDIVGYTLTNTITMMEAVTDIMRVNPLGVGTIVNSARENAEEGLGRIRDALHILRGNEVSYPTGKAALERMITIFMRATGVNVESIFQDSTTDLGEEIDDTLYHIVQESMLNSFRHGKATNIRLFLRRESDYLRISVRDNGTPMGKIKEDIGLSGMRERIDSLGGTLDAHILEDGFEVDAIIPVAKAGSLSG